MTLSRTGESSQVIARFQRIRQRSEELAQRTPAAVQALLLAGVFATAAWAATTQLAVTWQEVEWGALGAAVVGVPLTILANTLEFVIAARLGGGSATLVSGARVAVTATAANLLPLPGGFFIRFEALRRSGVRARTAAGATVAVALTWIGSALTLAGLMLTTGDRSVLAGAATAVAGLALVCAALAVLRSSCQDRAHVEAWFLRVLAVELLSIGAGALRLLLLLRAIGLGWQPAAAVVLALSGVVATAVGVVPAGLGVKEVLASALAAVVGLPAAAGLVVSVLDRVVGLVVHAPLAASLTMSRARPTPQTDRR